MHSPLIVFITDMRKTHFSQTGFTLIELVIVITLTGIVAVILSRMTGGQMEAYVSTASRTNLVNMAVISLRKIGRDVRDAVPETIRVSGNSLEFVPITAVARYRSQAWDDASSDYLDFSSADSSFQVLGNILQPPPGSRLVIYNFGWADGMGPVAGANLYGSVSSGALSPSGSHVISPLGNEITVTEDGQNDLITLDSPFQFSFASPTKRFYVVQDAVSYVCGDGDIRRFSAYGLHRVQPVDRNAAPLSTALGSALLVDHVLDCRFTYLPGASQRNALLTITLTLLDKGERIRLIHQVHVSNRS